METVRVDICYRPLRIAWAIRAGDMDALRSAARISFALWGGRFNPIVVVDQQKLAQEVIDSFRVDVILPLGESEEVKQFPKKFPHLITPFSRDNVFVGDGEGGARSNVLDIYNALLHVEDKPEWKAVKERGLRLYTWAKDDPLSDVFSMHFGEYPSKEDIKIDYRGYLEHVSEAKEVPIDPAGKLRADLFDHPSIAFISRIDVRRHYRVQRGWDTPGFFHGDASNFDDLVCYWNLRAGDIQLLFVDVRHLERYGEAVAAWGKAYFRYVLYGTDIENRHGQELLPGIAVVPNGGNIDIEEAQGFPVVNPHRIGVPGKCHTEDFARGREVEIGLSDLRHSVNRIPFIHSRIGTKGG